VIFTSHPIHCRSWMTMMKPETKNKYNENIVPPPQEPFISIWLALATKWRNHSHPPDRLNERVGYIIYMKLRSNTTVTSSACLYLCALPNLFFGCFFHPPTNPRARCCRAKSCTAASYTSKSISLWAIIACTVSSSGVSGKAQCFLPLSRQ
jgi:hypothetical protein